MIKGMTGFGSAQMAIGKIKILVEIKSVNHRYLDVSYYLPHGCSSLEDKIIQIVRKDAERGKVTVAVKIIQKPGQNISLNKENVRSYLNKTKTLAKEFKLKNDLTISDLLRLPGVMEIKEVFVDSKDLWPGVEKGLRKALGALVTMRKREGKSITNDVTDKLKKMSTRLKSIQARIKIVLAVQKKKVKLEEFKSFQKSIDVNEEISRMLHYIDELKKILRSKESVGKRIDFIAQEMQRETNTLGSKLQDKVVSNAVISLKSKIEKIREQAQNIE